MDDITKGLEHFYNQNEDTGIDNNSHTESLNYQNLNNDVMEDEEESVTDESDNDLHDQVIYDDDDNDSSQSVKEANNEYKNTLNSIQSGPSETLRLYSGFDEIIGNSANSDSFDEKFQETDTIDAHDVSSHLKGALAFGLASKGNSSRIGTNLHVRKQEFSHSKGNKSGIVVYRPANSKSKRVERPKVDKIERKKEQDNIDHLSEELQIGYRILTDLMTDSLKTYNSAFMESIELNKEINGDYLEVIEDPIWLPKIKEKLLRGDHKSITDLILDIRQMLQNAYKYFGSPHSFSRKGLRLEFILEQKLNLLSKDIKAKCTLEMTHNVSMDEVKQMNRTKSSRITVQGDNYFSYLLFTERGFRPARDKEEKMKRVELIRLAKLNKEKQYVDWDVSLFSDPLAGPIHQMWEIPQINQFIFLSVNALNIAEISIYELERILIIPEASLTLRVLMTSLVSSPQQRSKITEKPFMPYNVWARKLAGKVYTWYKAFHKEKKNSSKVFHLLGIDPMFWEVCGKRNPFDSHLFHQLTLYQRIWLVKTLCDYIAHNHKSIQEVIAEMPEEIQREKVIGKDREGNIYLYFTQAGMVSGDLRIYRCPKFTYHREAFIESEHQSPKPFTHSQLQRFKKIMKLIKKGRDGEDDCKYSQKEQKKKKKKKKNKRSSKSYLQPITPVWEKRIRPERLRQTPKARYNEDLSTDEEDSSSDEHSKVKTSRRRDIDELLYGSKKGSRESKRTESTPQDGRKKRKLDTDEMTRENSQPIIEGGNNLTETDKMEGVVETVPEKTTHFRKKHGKRKNSCETCGKSFASKSAMYGHSATHARKKDMDQLREDSNENKDEIIERVKEEKLNLCKEESSIQSPSDNNELKIVPNVTVKKEENSCEFKMEPKKEDNDTDAVSSLPKTNKDKVESETSDSEMKLCREIDSSVSQSLTTSSLDKNAMCDFEKVDDTETDNKMKIDNNVNINENNMDSGLPESNSTEVNLEKQCNRTEKESTEIINEEESNIDKIADIVPKNLETDPKDSEVISSKEPETNSSAHSESGEDYGPTIFTPNMEEFQLVVASITELRDLILKFGEIPEKLPKPAEITDQDSSQHNQSETEEDMNSGDDEIEHPRCEVKLHKALCKMLGELLPLEVKMKNLQRQMRKKLWTEFHDWKKRDSTYVDPAEEAWKSDPEPDPIPSATQTPKVSSSSSSSDESIYDDGTRKRKLRKRRVKKIIRDISPSSSNNGHCLDSPAEDTVTVSSRGRIRKVKKIYNYDEMDFEKLARQAKKEAQEEKERKRKLREGEVEEEKDVPPQTRKYILNKQGNILGYISNDGKMHRINDVNESQDSPEVIPNNPKVVVSAKNDEENPVSISLFGDQALKLMEHVKKFQNEVPRLIKITRCSKTYTFMTDSKIVTQNIPGFPNSDYFMSPTKITPKVVHRLTSPESVSKAPSPQVLSVSTTSVSLLKGSSPISTTSHITNGNHHAGSALLSTNPVALAYQGVCSAPLVKPYLPAGPMSVTSASLTAATKVVTASPSVVTSVPPINATTVPRQTVSIGQPERGQAIRIGQPEQGQAIRIGISSDKLTQLIQKPGQRIVAIPNGKGGYSITLVSSNKNTSQTAISTVSPSKAGLPQQTSQVFLNPTTTISNQSQHVVTQLVNSQPELATRMFAQPALTAAQVVNMNPASSMTRQVIIQNAASGAQTILQQPQQMVQIQQQSPQKLVQVVHSAGSGRQLVQLIQGSQIIMAGNNMTMQQQQQQPPPGTILMQHPSKDAVQQQFIYPQPVQEPSKIIQVATPQNQYIQQQQIVLQQTPQQQHIILQQPTNSTKENESRAPYIHQAMSQCDLTQKQVSSEGQQFRIASPQSQIRLASPVQLQQKSVSQGVQVLQRANVPMQQSQQVVTMQQQVHRQQQAITLQHVPQTSTPQQITLQQNAPQQITLQQNAPQQITLQQNAPQQITLQQNSPTIVQRPQVVVQQQQLQNKVAQQPARPVQQYRLVMLQTSEGQNICSLSSDGKLSVLNSEQIQPLIANGTLKLS